MADTDTPNPAETGPEEGSLEDSSTVVESNAAPSAGQPEASSEPAPEISSESAQPPDSPVSGLDGGGGANTPRPAPPRPKAKWWRRLAGRFNVYFLLFIFIVLIAITIVVAAYLSSQRSGGSGTSSQNLSPSALEQLADSGTPVGRPDQILNVQSSTVFSGKVLMRQGLEVAGNLKIGGTLALNGLSVAGTGQFGQLQVNKDL